jgi:hypothetical protein
LAGCEQGLKIVLIEIFKRSGYYEINKFIVTELLISEVLGAVTKKLFSVRGMIPPLINTHLQEELIGPEDDSTKFLQRFNT